MRVTLIFCILVFASVAQSAEYTNFCNETNAKANLDMAHIPGYQSGRRVIGKGRAYFHSAPDEKCRDKKIFIVPGDLLNAYAEYNGFTRVMYIHPVTGADTEGWIKTGRLEFTGTGISPNYDEK